MNWSDLLRGTWVCLLAGLISQTSLAQNNMIFGGGIADGFGQASFQQAANNTVFVGGSGDGFDQGSFQQVHNNAVFASGTASRGGDGFDQGSFQQAANNPLFAGGSGDGFSHTSFLLTETWSTVAQIYINGLMKSAGGTFQFGFTNVPGASFTVLTTTNLAAVPSDWGVLGAVTEGPPGRYTFSDPTSVTNQLQRFYKVRYP